MFRDDNDNDNNNDNKNELAQMLADWKSKQFNHLAEAARILNWDAEKVKESTEAIVNAIPAKRTEYQNVIARNKARATKMTQAKNTQRKAHSFLVNTAGQQDQQQLFSQHNQQTMLQQANQQYPHQQGLLNPQPRIAVRPLLDERSFRQEIADSFKRKPETLVKPQAPKQARREKPVMTQTQTQNLLPENPQALRMPVASPFYNSTNFFPAEKTQLANPAIISAPQTPMMAKDVINLAELDKAVKILRGKINAGKNCTRYAEDLIKYLQTGIMPSHPTDRRNSTQDHFRVFLWKAQPENIEMKPVTISASIIDRHSELGAYAPPTQIPFLTENGEQFNETSILDVDHFTQIPVHYAELNKNLKNTARQHPENKSYGIISLGHCGEYIDLDGHLLVYIATADDVLFVDIQGFNGRTQTGSAFYKHLDENYLFYNGDEEGGEEIPVTENTINPVVFITPMNAKPSLTAKNQINQEDKSIEIKKEAEPRAFGL